MLEYIVQCRLGPNQGDRLHRGRVRPHASRFQRTRPTRPVEHKSAYADARVLRVEKWQNVHKKRPNSEGFGHY